MTITSTSQSERMPSVDLRTISPTHVEIEKQQALQLFGSMKAVARNMSVGGTARAVFALLDWPAGLTRIDLATQAQIPKSTATLIRTLLIKGDYATSAPGPLTVAKSELADVAVGINGLCLDIVKEELAELAHNDIIGRSLTQYASTEDLPGSTIYELSEAIKQHGAHHPQSALYRGLGAFATLKGVNITMDLTLCRMVKDASTRYAEILSPDLALNNYT